MRKLVARAPSQLAAASVHYRTTDVSASEVSMGYTITI
jgi:hypothetical protein